MAGISVIICCYNSAARLPQTLKHLALQKGLAAISWEVIVVDNASTDETAKVAGREWYGYRLNEVGFRVVNEPNPGLSHARLKGINETNYECVVFCDDDNWLDETYLINAFNVLQGDPSIGALGGFNTAVTDGQLPEWFEEYKGWYAAGKQKETTGDISDRMYVWGAGVVLRKDLYIKAFAKVPSILTGRQGKALTAGEDAEMCMRFLFMGYKLFYIEEISLKHYMPESRLQVEYRDKLIKGILESNLILNKYIEMIGLTKLSVARKARIFAFSLGKILLSKSGLRKQADLSYEVTMAYYLGSVKTRQVTREMIMVKKAYDTLKIYAYN